MKKIWWSAMGMLLAVGLAGCQSDKFGWPNWLRPGNAQQQQMQATRFDPYPENEPGPKMVGVRPQGYENPVPEVDRARWPKPCP
jgi:hypothetical protein